MPALIALHVVAGATAITAGAGAVWVMKGSLRHRQLGIIFAIALILTIAIAIYLAAFVPPLSSRAAPPQASISVALLTGYLVATAWSTVRQKPSRIGRVDYATSAFGALIALGLSIFGAISATRLASPRASIPYFVFAAFAAFATALDVRMILRGGLSASQRIARHLWRMCAAWFFACAFFFIGQQKVMPTWLRGSPLLLLAAVVPLLVMACWLLRIQATQIDMARRARGLGPGHLSRLAFKSRRAPCPS